MRRPAILSVAALAVVLSTSSAAAPHARVRAVRVATVVAPSPAPAPPPAAAPPPTVAVPLGQRVADWAIQQLGTPYVYGGNGPYGYDCSGLTRAAWSTVGVDLPRVAADQFTAGTHVALASAQPGDLVFFASGWWIYHVAIYVGGGLMVEAPYSGGVVRVVPVTADGLTPMDTATRPA